MSTNIPGRLAYALDETVIEIAQPNLHSVVKDEHVFSWVLHDLVAKIPHKERYIGRCARFILAWYREGVLLPIVEEQL